MDGNEKESIITAIIRKLKKMDLKNLEHIYCFAEGLENTINTKKTGGISV